MAKALPGCLGSMADSFRAAAAAERDAAAAIEERFSRLTAGEDPGPRKKGGTRLLTEEEERNESFRIACGAFVKGKIKPGVRQKYDLAEAARLKADGADVDSADADGWTALHWAAAEGYGQVVKYLVDGGRGAATVDATDDEGCTPLWSAAYNGEYQVALALLAAGADLAPKGKASGGAAMTASNAARSMRNPTIAVAKPRRESRGATFLETGVSPRRTPSTRKASSGRRTPRASRSSRAATSTTTGSGRRCARYLRIGSRL